MNEAPPSTIWRWVNAARWPRARTWCRWVFLPIVSAPSATARSSPSTPVTARRRSRKTAARTSSSPQSELMRHRIFGALVAVALVVTAAAPASAANKEHQQLMADIRMLQEQSQILQNLLASLTDVVRTLSVHLDDRFDRQGTALTKGFADQKLILDTLANDARVIRERLDDNNVRIGSLTQAIEALRG